MCEMILFLCRRTSKTFSIQKANDPKETRVELPQSLTKFFFLSKAAFALLSSSLDSGALKAPGFHFDADESRRQEAEIGLFIQIGAQ